MKQFTERVLILFFLPNLEGGGAQRTVLNLLEHLDQDRYQPYLAVTRKSGPLLAQVPKGVPMVDLKGSRTSSHWYHIRQLMVAVASLEPDLVVSFLNQANVVALLAKMFSPHQFKLIISARNNLTAKFSNRPVVKKWGKRMFVRWIYPYADYITTVSEGVKANLVHDFGLPPARIRAIHSSVEIGKIRAMAQTESAGLSPNGHLKTIIAVGSLDVQKGYGDLIRAFATVRGQVPARLVILGEGPLRRELEMTIEALGLTNHVHMPGFVINPFSYLAQADLFVLSSYWEGLPVALIEAMACGLPVIATNCDYGPGEIISHSQTGVLVPVGDIERLSQEMVRVLTDESETRRLRAGALCRAEKFDTPRMCRLYEELFEAVLQGQNIEMGEVENHSQNEKCI